MKLQRVLQRIRYYAAKTIVDQIEYFNGPRYIKLKQKLLASMGMNIRGNLCYVHKSVKFDDFNLISLGDGVVLSLEVHLLTHDWSRRVAYDAIAKRCPPQTICIMPSNEILRY